MKKYGGSVGQRVDSVEHPSMTGNTVSHIFDSFVSLDRGDDYISRESGNCDKGTYQDDIRSGEGSQETEKVTNHSGTDYTTQKTFPCRIRCNLPGTSRPKSLPQMNCMTSFISVRNTRNNSRPRPPELNPGSSGSDRR